MALREVVAKRPSVQPKGRRWSEPSLAVETQRVEGPIASPAGAFRSDLASISMLAAAKPTNEPADAASAFRERPLESTKSGPTDAEEDGKALDTSTRERMEARFGRDFSKVRVFSGPDADRSTRSLGARAYTFGTDIVFARGEYGAAEGSRRDHLIAHELAHVVQVADKPASLRLPISQPSDAAEIAADRAAEDVCHGRSVRSLETQQPAIRCALVVAGGRKEDDTSRAAQQAISEAKRAVDSGTIPPERRDLVKAQILQAELTLGRYRSTLQSGVSQVGAMGTATTANPIGGILALIAVALVWAFSSAASREMGKKAAAEDLSKALHDLASTLRPLQPVEAVPPQAAPAPPPAASAPSTSVPTVPPVSTTKETDKTSVPSKTETKVPPVSRPEDHVSQAQQVGKGIRGHTTQIAIHLARFLNRSVSGKDPDHQRDPNRDKPSWWSDIKKFIQFILRQGLTQKQLLRELLKGFTAGQLAEIRTAIVEVAKAMGEEPPDFPPTTTP